MQTVILYRYIFFNPSLTNIISKYNSNTVITGTPKPIRCIKMENIVPIRILKKSIPIEHIIGTKLYCYCFGPLLCVFLIISRTMQVLRNNMVIMYRFVKLILSTDRQPLCTLIDLRDSRKLHSSRQPLRQPPRCRRRSSGE